MGAAAPITSLNLKKAAEITYLEGSKQQTRNGVTYLEISK